MANMWQSRALPVLLDFDEIRDGSFVLKRQAPVSESGPVASTSANNGSLRDQRALTLADNLDTFVPSTNRLALRLQAGEETISFDKDGDGTLDFVTATANLRSAAYGIGGKARWGVKEMAALHLLRMSHTTIRNIHLQLKGSLPPSTSTLCAPNTVCGVCRDAYATPLCDPARAMLGEAVSAVLGNAKREVSVYEDKHVLSDPDWDRTLASLGVTRGKFLSIVDEDGEWGTIAVGLGMLPPNHPADGPTPIPPSPLPHPPRKARPATPPPPPTSLKRPAPDDEIIVTSGPPAKRAWTQSSKAAIVFHPGLSSPSKRCRLEEDGFVLFEDADDQMKDDVIEID